MLTTYTFFIFPKFEDSDGVLLHPEVQSLEFSFSFLPYFLFFKNLVNYLSKRSKYGFQTKKQKKYQKILKNGFVKRIYSGHALSFETDLKR